MEALFNFDRAITHDSMVAHQKTIHHINIYQPECVLKPGPGCISIPGDTSLPRSLDMGYSHGDSQSEGVSIVTAESQKADRFSEEPILAITAVIPEAVEIILDLLIESRATTPEINDLKI